LAVADEPTATAEAANATAAIALRAATWIFMFIPFR
jgi:hypothetical protein